MSNWSFCNKAALVVACLCAGALPGLRSHAAAGQTPEERAPAGRPVFNLPRKPPKGAITLFSGKPGEMKANWYKRQSTEPPPWIVGPDGVTVAGHADIVTKAEFGDALFHVEWRDLVDAQGKCLGDGNSGVGLQGRYEIQIFNSYGKARADIHDCGAVYNQVAPRINVTRKPGDWQSYDIIFRAPRLWEDGTVREKPRVTVFQNGALIQDNTEIKGPTGIQYGDFKGMPATAPLDLQGNHDIVQFRNIWVAPL